jgi:hypothetical protein
MAPRRPLIPLKAKVCFTPDNLRFTASTSAFYLARMSKINPLHWTREHEGELDGGLLRSIVGSVDAFVREVRLPIRIHLLTLQIYAVG